MPFINKKRYQGQVAVEQATTPLPKIQGKKYSIDTGFTQYLNEDTLDELIRQKHAYQGQLTVLPTGYSQGIVTTQTGTISIPDKIYLNRALDGDTVVVVPQGIDRQETELSGWKINKDMSDTTSTAVTVQQVGAVVGVIKSGFGGTVLKCIPASQQEIHSGFIMRPMDKRYPLIEVHNNFVKAPPGNQVFYVRLKLWTVSQKYPAGEITGTGELLELQELDDICNFCMESNGLTYNYKEKLSNITSVQAGEIRALLEGYENTLLKDCALDRSDVFELQQRNLDNICDLVRHLEGRRDIFTENGREFFCDKMIFTIDPSTAKDFDDSCHIDLLLKDGSLLSFREFVTQFSSAEQREQFYAKQVVGYEIGVHIADVTTYVQPGDALDINAYSTTTSVYITDRCCPMYPYELADGLCSLNPAVPRYAYSVIYRINKDAELLEHKVRFCRSVIVSYARLDYVCAQQMIDGNASYDGTLFQGKWPVADGYQEAIIEAVRHINRVALKLRRQRQQLGALQLDTEELRWRVSADMHVSVLGAEQASEAHHLIEELMVLTNCLVAMRLAASFPTCPVLRQHPAAVKTFPYNGALAESRLGQIDCSSGKSAIQSIVEVAGKWREKYHVSTELLNAERYAVNVVNQIFMSSGLMRAKYIAGMTADDSLIAHWGLHAQLYMHFTSPIRRYADDICHRMLTAALSAEKSVQDWDEYRKQPIYAYIPHELIIKEVSSVYSYTAALPPQDLRSLCDRLQPISEDKWVAHEHGAASGDVIDQVSGRELNIDLKNTKIKQKLFKAIDAIIDGGLDLDGYVQSRTDLDEADNRETLAYQAYTQTKNLLKDSLKLSVEQLRIQMQRCNELAIAAAQIEVQHHWFMLYYYIKERGEVDTALERNFLTSKAVFVSAKEGRLSFAIPEFGLNFKMTNCAEQKGNGTFVVRVDPTKPLNKQGGWGVREDMEDEGGEERVFVLFQPFDVRLVCAESVLEQVDVHAAAE